MYKIVHYQVYYPESFWLTWRVFLTWEYTLVHKTLDLHKEGGSRQQHLNVTFSPAKTAPSTPVGVGVLPAKQRAHLSRTNSCGIGASPSGTKLCNRDLEGSTNQAYSSGLYTSEFHFWGSAEMRRNNLGKNKVFTLICIHHYFHFLK